MAPHLILFSKQWLSSPDILLVFSILQGERVTLWRCGCTWSQMLHQDCSNTSIFQDVVGVWPLCPSWLTTYPCFARKYGYKPSNQYIWRVWGFWVSKLTLNCPSYSFKKQLILHKIFNLPTKHCKNTSIRIKPIQTLSTLTCALSLGSSHLDRLLWT